MRDSEVLWTAPGHVTARWHNVFIQVRSGALTFEALDAIETGARLTRAQLKRAIPYGAMIVILAGAPAVQGEVAVRQRELLQTLNADERLHVAVALEGEGPAVVMKRVLARAAMRSKRRHICVSVQDAAHLLLGDLGATDGEAALVAFAESLRLLALETSPPSPG